MLIHCPECEKEISDKAVSCPHCGYPITPTKQSGREVANGEKRQKKSTKKHRKLPNGFGQITKISGKFLRKPYRAMVTVGKTSEGEPIVKPLKPTAYFATYNEAYSALVEHQKNPYDVSQDMTMNELYERWKEDHFKELRSDGTKFSITAAWEYCEMIHDVRVKDFKIPVIKQLMENAKIIRPNEDGIDTEKPATNIILSRIKSVLNMMLDYAIQLELITTNYSRLYTLPKKITDKTVEDRESHISFTEEEMDKLWSAQKDNFDVSLILIQCYMGWRPQELCKLKVEDVYLDKRYIVGGSKTVNGIRRKVPIHSRILPIVSKLYDEAKADGRSSMFLSGRGNELQYKTYSYHFSDVINDLGLNPEHKPHDPRKTFVTRAKKAGMDDGAIKKIIGHAVNDITEKIYTDRDIEWLLSDIEKLP